MILNRPIRALFDALILAFSLSKYQCFLCPKVDKNMDTNLTNFVLSCMLKKVTN